MEEIAQSYIARNKYFVLALFSLNIFTFAGATEAFFEFPHIVKYLFSFFSFFSITLFSSRNRISSLSSQYNSIIRYNIILFILWSSIIIISSFNVSAIYFQRFFGAEYYLLPYLIPILFIFTRFELEFFKTFL